MHPAASTRTHKPQCVIPHLHEVCRPVPDAPGCQHQKQPCAYQVPKRAKRGIEHQQGGRAAACQACMHACVRACVGHVLGVGGSVSKGSVRSDIVVKGMEWVVTKTRGWLGWLRCRMEGCICA
eukprot:362816-Chlamydomonas_euryale.AAC.2